MQTFANTPEQVARELGVSGETVRRWIRSGRLDAVRLGSRNNHGNTPYRISREAIDRFLQPVEREETS